jgi:hypothetical protein
VQRLKLVLCGLLLTGSILLLADTADAQRLGQYARASVESPQVLARGGAGVALASAETALFYNPAQLASLRLPRPRIEILSAQGTASTNLFGNTGFFLNDVREAAEEGFSFPLTSEDRELFDAALERGRRATVGQAAATLPAVTFSMNQMGFAGGIFGTSTSRLRFEDAGGGIPLLDFFGQADFIAAGAAATMIPNTPMAVGSTVRVVRRYLTSKTKDLLEIDPDHEQLYVFSGSTLAVDAGLHIADLFPVLPGQLSAGLAVYDLVGGGFSYRLDSEIAFTGDGATNQQEVDAILASLEGRDGDIAVRIGAAYRMPALLGPFGDLTIAADWFSAPTSESEQPALAGFRIGADIDLAGALSFRAGIGQGYPSAGFGLQLPFVHLDYSFYGIEDGRLPGQLERYNHVVRVRFGIF